MNKAALIVAGIVWICGSALGQPQPADPAQPAGAKPEEAVQKTEITATEEATMDLENRTATFSGDVRVIDPRFQMKTRRLTVYFSKDPAGLETATAEGGVVIIQTQTEDKKSTDAPAVGRAERATYNAATGDIELTGSPILEQGPNRHVATSSSTRMILNRAGKLRTIGPSKTEIIEKNKSTIPGQKKQP